MERVRKENDSHQSGTSQRVAQARSSRSSPQKDLASGIDNSPLMVAQRKKLQSLFGGAAQLQDEPISKPNNTGLPDNLKSGIESLSGMSMDHVKVHYNSSMPAQLNALAYAQGSDIHVAPGQEKHLPHEAWHVVQQAQGRVKPTMQMKGAAVNDGSMLVAQRLSAEKLNVVGEDHVESSARREREREYCGSAAPGGYWLEYEFQHKDSYGDNRELLAINLLMDAEDILKKFKSVLERQKENSDEWFKQEMRRFNRELTYIWPAQLEVYLSQVKDKQWTWRAEEYSEKYEAVFSLFGEYMKARNGNPVPQGVLDGLHDILDFLEQETPGFHFSSLDDVDKERSNHMHKIANLAQEDGRKGVWKVGFEHVSDMGELDDGRQYHLETKEAFNDGLKAFMDAEAEKSQSPDDKDVSSNEVKKKKHKKSKKRKKSSDESDKTKKKRKKK